MRILACTHGRGGGGGRGPAPRQVLPVGLVFLPLVGEGVVLPPVPVQEVLQLVPVRVLLFKPREKVQKPKIARV